MFVILNVIQLISAYLAAFSRICKSYPPLNPLLGRGLRSLYSEVAVPRW